MTAEDKIRRMLLDSDSPRDHELAGPDREIWRGSATPRPGWAHRFGWWSHKRGDDQTCPDYLGRSVEDIREEMELLANLRRPLLAKLRRLMAQGRL